MSEIENCKVVDLIGKGNLLVTYACVKDDEKYGKAVRILVKKDDDTYGVNTTAKQIVKQFESMDLKGATVRFKSYEWEGRTTYKMFVQKGAKTDGEQ